MNFPVFDLHCDTAFAMLGEHFDDHISLKDNELHIDLNRASTFPGYAQCFACFTSNREVLSLPFSPQTLFNRELSVITDAFQQYSHIFTQAFTASQIEQNRRVGKMSGILTLEGPAGIDYSPDRLEALYALGFRMTTLSWNEKNPLTGSHVTGGGLTEQGAIYLKEAQRLGMIVDVSHISDEAFWDIMEITTAPIVASHSNSRTVWNVSRNLTDEMFSAICRTGGVVGINLYADFLGDKPDVDTVCNHIFHFLSMDPEGKHIALGGDLDGCDVLPKGLNGVQDYQKLAQRLLERGLTEATVYDIFWNNAIGVMKRCCM